MPVFPLLQVDAFSDRPLGGNPCAVVFDGEALDDATMLAIAREMNLSETAFVVPSDRADFGARYFTPLGEIPMAGHPTLATIHALVETERLALAGAHTEVTLELPAGVLPIEIEARGGRVERVTMRQARPSFGEPLDAARVQPAFGLPPADLDPELPVCVVSTGTPQLMVGVRDAEVLARVAHDGAAHAAWAAELGFFSTHLFALGGVEGGDTVARHFAPGPRGFEDPFTGSATGSMAALLFRHGRIGARVVAEQGHALGRPGRAFVEVLGRRDAIEGVRVGGAAVTVLRGDLCI
ncbi:MAG TPA: PhzF family phenazine biosynthesis protein [Myxococcota bacterium]|nr:PhzF family phenazine biosynthesis protein [Myxococcota bacterium]